MAKDNETESNKIGVIPDFFHDIIAYIIPGYTVLILFAGNAFILGTKKDFFINNIDLKGFSLSLVAAYVLGRFFEQLGLMTIHHRKFPFVFQSCKIPSPKWSLIFDPKDGRYSDPFKNNVAKKIEEWLEKQDGTLLLATCKANRKDDYFNLIQFYLRERFPSVALYEKKQNASIVLTRSLAIIFFCNILIYFLMLTLQKGELIFSLSAFYWLSANFLFSSILYMRFQQDKVYHAMYIFETFIAMKKLLKSKNSNSGRVENSSV